MATRLSPEPGEGGEEEDEELLTEINITPLTDVFLVLLIIFMVASASAVDQAQQQGSTNQGVARPRLNEKAIQVNTPQGSGESTVVARDILVSVLPDGTILVEDEQVSAEGVGAALRARRKEGTDPRVVVRGDEEVAYRSIMRVINEARAAGFGDVALATRRGG
jgi:biopolymer transport protein ExbD